MLTLLEVTIKCQLLHGLIEDQEYLNSHVTVLLLTAFPPSLNPALMVIFFLFSGSLSCLIWQGEVHKKSQRFALFLQLLIYLSHCFEIGVVLLQIFTSRAVDAPRLERSLFLIDVSQYKSTTT